MSKLGYYLIIKPLSYFPLAVLYRFSDVLFFIIFHLARYRRGVVMDNLRRSFPAFAEWRLQAIARAFYRHLGDLLAESVRMMSMPAAESVSRCRVINPEMLDAYYREGRSVILSIGHYNNWELLVQALPLQVRHQVVGIYMPIKNKFFEQQMNTSRGKHGLVLVSTPDIGSFVRAHKTIPSLYVLAGDQSPTHARRVHWMPFLNQDTPVSLGTEFYAIKYDMPVVFGQMRKESRGKYTLEFSLISANPRESASGDITTAQVRALESSILAEPAYWLWTHKRWKRKRRADE